MMTPANPKDAFHQGQLYRVLVAVADSPFLSKNLIFKGGTCAAMLGYLDRFSVDLDFDRVSDDSIEEVRTQLEAVLARLQLRIKSAGATAIQYELKYEAPAQARNTLQIDVVGSVQDCTVYQASYLADIDRHLLCHTIESMFAHKLVAVTERFERHGAVAGRDIYDLHYFFSNGYDYLSPIIEKRTGMHVTTYFSKLMQYVREKIDDRTLDEDINTLLPYQKFAAIRKTLRLELLMMIRAEIARLAEDAAKK